MMEEVWAASTNSRRSQKFSRVKQTFLPASLTLHGHKKQSNLTLKLTNIICTHKHKVRCAYQARNRNHRPSDELMMDTMALEKKTGDSSRVVGLRPGGIVTYGDGAPADDTSAAGWLYGTLILATLLNPPLALLSARLPPPEPNFWPNCGVSGSGEHPSSGGGGVGGGEPTATDRPCFSNPPSPSKSSGGGNASARKFCIGIVIR